VAGRTSAPKASSLAARRRMKSTRQRDTHCEVMLRSAIHRLGLRFRVHWHIPGTRRRADVAFPSTKVIVYVDGCFWHMCPQHATLPKANERWWRDKLMRNVERDRDTDAMLEARGWLVLRFWEHEDMIQAATTVAATVVHRKREEAAHETRRHQ
jgi:DNA mismatch endonuclease (patch repair protein)